MERKFTVALYWGNLAESSVRLTQSVFSTQERRTLDSGRGRGIQRKS